MEWLGWIMLGIPAAIVLIVILVKYRFTKAFLEYVSFILALLTVFGMAVYLTIALLLITGWPSN